MTLIALFGVLFCLSFNICRYFLEAKLGGIEVMRQSFKEQLLVAKKQQVKDKKKSEKKQENFSRRELEIMMGANKNTYYRRNGAVRQRG